jgi:hypothetical protein
MLGSLLAQVHAPPAPVSGDMNIWQFAALALPIVITFLTSILAVIQGYMNALKLQAAAGKAEETTAKVQEVHLLFNSRFSELLNLTAKSSHAEGVAEATKTIAADAAKLADPTGSIAGAAARDERAADANAAREIRAADFQQAHANAQARDAAPAVPGTGATMEMTGTLHSVPAAVPDPPAGA